MTQSPTQPCPCGSGLRRLSCCDTPPGTLRPTEAIRHLTPLIERATQALRTGARAVAEQLAIDVLELAPGQTGALAVLYEVRKSTGPASAVEALIRRLVALDPNNFWALNEITLLLLGKGSLAEAELHARNAIRIAPEAPQAHNLMGMVLTEARRPQVGEYHYRRVITLSGARDPILLANLAWNLKTQGRMEESRALYQEAGRSGPPVMQTLLGWARMEEADRNFPQAADLLDQAERVVPDNPSILLARAILLGRMRRQEEALAVLDRIAVLTPDGLGPNELLEKGRLLDQLGRYDDAWVAFEHGKRRARELTGYGYMAGHANEMARRLKGFFAAGRLRTLPRGTLREGIAQPLFILGFPRSGTTLVEQTLSAHPRIAAGDELPMIGELTDLMPRLFESLLSYPEALAELWMGDRREGLDTLRDHYFDKARQLRVLRGDAAWFTDKMPLNETHLGLIGLIFPQAPLMHVLRHPLDVVLSVFSNHLTHGFFCAYALDSIAQHMVLVHDLVAHYRAEMPLRYMPVRYEDIVERQEASVRSMLGFVGEEFDPGCLQFHENRRYARTASYAQVTEKLYASSRFRYRDYLRHLEPLLDVLGPLIERLGYSV
jgi:tetratricopeptide (TPR) repeat protein